MNFTVSRNDFYRILQKVINVIPGKSTMDILYNVLVIAEDGQLKVIATDLEITQIAWTACNVSGNGAIAVPGKLLLDIIREMPEIDLAFSADENLKILIETPQGEFKISGQNKNEFPSVPLVESDQSIQMQNNTLKRMIEKTIFACSMDNLRPALTGVFCQILENEYRMVATDGHRLAKIINPKFKDPGFTRNVIIPTKALNFVARNLPENGAHKIVFSENHVLFELDNTKIYSRLITDPYPDYERVIPMDNTKEMFIQRNDFISVVKRVALLANPMTYQIILKIEENALTIHAQDIDFGGEAKESMLCKYNGDALEIAYNANYLNDILKHLDSEEIKFTFEDADGPGVLFPVDENSEEEVLMLLMPVRLGS